MSPMEALALIDRVLSNVSGTRNDHIKLQEAISIIRNLVTQTSAQTEGEE